MDVHVIGVGKDQYNEYLDQMVEGRILPWTEDSQSEGYPVWTDWEAGQRDVYFLNRNGIVDTTFNITPYDPGNPEDYTYIMNLILDLRNETWGQDTVTDIDGNVYETVQIGEQLWMKENLKVTHYQNGDEIPTGYSNSEWSNLLTGAYAVYDDDSVNADVYGYLYNWYAVETGNLAPEGWHVPTDDEIKKLEMYLGMSQEEADGTGHRGTNEGSKLAGMADLWNDGNLVNNPEFGTSGFNLLPGGYRGSNYGYYNDMGYYGYFWSSTENNSLNAWSRILSCNYSEISRYYDNKKVGFSVRCVRDEPETGTILVPYSSGWNMVGLPLEVEDATYQTLFPSAQGGTLYSFDGTYQPEEYLELGSGYLLRLTSDGPVTFTGIPINELTISLSEGWNLFSGLSATLSPEDVYAHDIIQNGTIYGLDAVYYSPESIDPGMGYWVRAIEDGEITLTSGRSLKQISIVNRMENANSLSFSSENYSTNLYFGVEVPDNDRLSYSLPPKFPQMAFDARFSGDTKVLLESGEIEVLNQSETLTIEYDIKIDAGVHMKWVLILSSEQEIVLEASGEITVPSEERFTLNRVPELPDTFTLNQNYPNPFNNKTSIHYYLPVDEHVIVRIYNLSGILVNTLVNTDQIFGYHNVTWNGVDFNNKPVSSGIYVYKVTAGKNRLTGKCVFLK